MSTKNFYLTTTLPYVNAEPHVGFAMELIRADAIVRYRKLLGDEVFFNTGTDEHGAKIHEAAEKEGLAPQAYVDRLAPRFKELAGALGVADDIHFIRTTDAHHKLAAQEMWRRCFNAGDIYKKNYSVKYCVGCELEKTDSELVDGKCPIHPNREIEMRDEENYFFRWSKYQEPLLAYYKAHPDFVIPDFRFNEIRAFVERGLEDFSVSRLKTKMPWGVPVPDDCVEKGDEGKHVMYVWFDALTNYVSTLGWPEDEENFRKFWQDGTPVQYCGKDNNRQQSAMWQAMLMSAKLPNTRHVVIDGFILGAGGQKMSKSLGNVISPFDVVDFFKPHTPFPEDVLRFVLLHDIPSFEDGELSMESIKQSYATHLQNGIGNLTSRIMKMATSHGVTGLGEDDGVLESKISEHMKKFDLHAAMQVIWAEVGAVDKHIQETEPFKVIKVKPEEGKAIILFLLTRLSAIAKNLEPFLPRTSAEVLRLIKEHKMPEKPLFNRLP